jgi:multiple sugar transport system substrate-binding protein
MFRFRRVCFVRSKKGASMFYSKRLRRFVVLAIVLIVCSSCAKRASGPMKASSPPANFAFLGKPTSDITFLSTQMNPVEEAGKMRNAILKDFPGKVDFRPNDNSYIFNQIDSLLQADPSKSILMGATHGDLVGLYERNALRPLDDLFARLEHDRKFSNQLLDLCRLNGKNIYYVPWMQATFVMVANKKALPYIPKGVELDFLTYDQLRQWAKNIHDKTGMTALGFPAGKNGLMHRFFQGYLYPSFTASTLLKFRSPEAKAMWEYFRDLWTLVHPGSLVYSTMAEPLLTGEVWIAWDHTARFMKAFKERPDDFVAFPTPIGPRGRGFIAVVSGLSIPLGSADIANQAMLIDYLTRAEIQTKTLNEVGFFPAVAVGADSAIPRHLQELSSAVDMQANDRYSIPVLLPQGLGVRGGDYNNLFMLTFSEIVLRGKPPTQVLNENAAELQRILDEQNARCWLPDTSDARPCKIE